MRPDGVHFVVGVVHLLQQDVRSTGGRCGGRGVRLCGRPGHEVWPVVRYEVRGRYPVDVRRQVGRLLRGRR